MRFAPVGRVITCNCLTGELDTVEILNRSSNLATALMIVVTISYIREKEVMLCVCWVCIMCRDLGDCVCACVVCAQCSFALQPSQQGVAPGSVVETAAAFFSGIDYTLLLGWGRWTPEDQWETMLHSPYAGSIAWSRWLSTADKSRT